jgi:hypothetical protein
VTAILAPNLDQLPMKLEPRPTPLTIAPQAMVTIAPQAMAR